MQKGQKAEEEKVDTLLGAKKSAHIGGIDYIWLEALKTLNSVSPELKRYTHFHFLYYPFLYH